MLIWTTFSIASAAAKLSVSIGMTRPNSMVEPVSSRYMSVSVRESHGILGLAHDGKFEKTAERVGRKAEACEELALGVDDDGAVIADKVVRMERGILPDLKLDETQSLPVQIPNLWPGCLPFGDGFDIRCGDGLTMRRKRPIKIGCS